MRVCVIILYIMSLVRFYLHDPTCIESSTTVSSDYIMLLVLFQISEQCAHVFIVIAI